MAQTVPDNGNWSDIAAIINANNAELNVNKAYCDYATSTSIPLTTTLTAVGGWAKGGQVDAVNIAVSGSEFTCSSLGILSASLSRVYENTDNNPADQVTVTIAIVKNGDTLNPEFTATVPIGSATAGDEPAPPGYTDPFLIRVEDVTDYYEIYVSGQDDGADPQETNLIRMKLVANMIANLP